MAGWRFISGMTSGAFAQGALLILGALLASAGPLGAQTVAGADFSSEVTVNLGALDQLGPPSTVPGLTLQRWNGQPQTFPGAPSFGSARGAAFFGSAYGAAGDNGLPPVTLHRPRPASFGQASPAQVAAEPSRPRPAASSPPPARVASAEPPAAPPVVRVPPARSSLTPSLAQSATLAPSAAPTSPSASSEPNSQAAASPSDLSLASLLPAIQMPGASGTSAAAPIAPAVVPPPPPPAFQQAPVVNQPPTGVVPPKLIGPDMGQSDDTPPPSAPRDSGAAAPSAADQQASLGSLPSDSQNQDSQSQGSLLASLPFTSGGAVLSDSARASLAGVAKRMSGDATLSVQVLAYAAGNEATSNQARRLSLSRALAVRSYLVDQGVISTRIDVRSLGERVPYGSADRVDLMLEPR